jgi:hypothetical protein
MNTQREPILQQVAQHEPEVIRRARPGDGRVDVKALTSRPLITSDDAEARELIALR